MTREQKKEWLEKTYLGKTVESVTDFTNTGVPPGCRGIVQSIAESGGGSNIRVRWENIGNLDTYLIDVKVIEEAPIIHKEKEGIKILKRTLENVDEYGNAYIIQLLPPDEKYIYLSTALRTLLDVKDGDFVSFAIDNENKLYYICKENDTANGYQIVNGKIESNVEWRNLYNCFNSEKTKIEEGKLKFHVSHYEREQEDVPDYHLFLINHPWFQESKKNKKEVQFVEKLYVEDRNKLDKLIEGIKQTNDDWNTYIAPIRPTSYTIGVEEMAPIETKKSNNPKAARVRAVNPGLEEIAIGELSKELKKNF